MTRPLRYALWALLLAVPVPSFVGAAEPGPIRFREASADWNLSFRHHHGGSGELYMPETMGSGVVLFDYDGDGDADVFFVDSGAFPGYEGETPRSRLFRNDPVPGGGGARRFVDVTETAGIEVAGYGMGATAGDVDGDDDPDLYVTAFGRDQLFENLGDGRFRDATDAADLGNPGWGVSAAFADTDSDGDLDLYVANYVDFTLETNHICGLEERGLRSYCHPDVYGGVPDRFYENSGSGRFREATAEAGLARGSAEPGKGLGVVFGDVDGDGDPDLYVANDMTPNFLFENDGSGSFEEIALLSGTALSERGQPEAGMGVELADLDADGRPDLFVTHLDLQTNAVYRNLGNRIFTDARHVSRLAEASITRVGFGVVAGDFDRDGLTDLAVANGHIIHNVEQWGTGSTYKQPNQLFRAVAPGRFAEVVESGLGGVVRSSRGLAAGDLDMDGDLDLVVSNSNDLSETWENVTGGAGGWLAVSGLAVGSRVAVEAGEVTAVREARTASSYASQNEATLHFGLGPAEEGSTVTVEVAWPGGGRRVVRGVPAGRRVVLPR